MLAGCFSRFGRVWAVAVAVRVYAHGMYDGEVARLRAVMERVVSRSKAVPMIVAEAERWVEAAGQAGRRVGERP